MSRDVSLEDVIKNSTLSVVAERVSSSASKALGLSFQVQNVLYSAQPFSSDHTLITVEEANKSLWDQIGQRREQNRLNGNVTGYTPVPVPFPTIPTYESSLSPEAFAKAPSVILVLRNAPELDEGSSLNRTVMKPSQWKVKFSRSKGHLLRDSLLADLFPNLFVATPIGL